MLSVTVSSLLLIASLCFGIPILEAQGSVGSLNVDNTSLPTNLEWETVTLPGANPVDPARYVVACSSMLGVGLDGRSCFNALGYAPHGELQEIWAHQGRVPPGIRRAVQLPVAIFSDDTNCIIQPDLVPPMSVARASADNVSDAARAVIIRCVLSRRIGGVAINIGGDNSLQVQVKDFKTPAYDCTNSIRSTAVSCRYILDDMLRTETVERMGRVPDREVTVSLPIVLRALVIDILKRTVATTWSDVWTALEVVNARCVRAGKGGHAIVAAALPGTAIPTTDLSVTIMDEPNPAVWTGKPDDTQPEAVGIAVA
ncbi:MAG: hypothetical protein LQ339_000068 [Xanthoria mediterranea]|nr:MAG: hypothetical protein LQ339_000068 [Xanthoria mediterranea]